LEAFVGPRPSERHESRHLDGTKTNNHLSNLQWGTYEENQMDRLAHGKSNRGERCGTSKLTSSQVLEISAIVSRQDRDMTFQQIGEMFGVGASTVHQIMTGASWGWLTGNKRNRGSIQCPSTTSSAPPVA
jgi:hypothetical protein